MVHLRSLDVHRFRGLADLRLEDCARVNLLVGQNNVGKTSVLEAIWLLFSLSNGDIMAPQRLAVSRGSNTSMVPPEMVWRFLFPDGDAQPHQPVEICLADQEGSTHTLTLTLRPATTIQLEPQGVASAGATGGDSGSELRVRTPEGSAQLPLTLEVRYQRDQGTPVQGEVTLSSGQLRTTTPLLASLGGARFLPALSRVDDLTLSQWLTVAQDAGKLEQLVELLRHFEPHLRALNVGVTPGSALPHVRGDVGLSRPLPLELFGLGMVRFVGIVLGIFNTAQGIVLADEVENGAYHENLETVWRAVKLATRDADVQFFATTHSYECLQAAVRAFEDYPDDLRVYRLERRDGAIQSVAMRYEQVGPAVREFQLEVR